MLVCLLLPHIMNKKSFERSWTEGNKEPNLELDFYPFSLADYSNINEPNLLLKILDLLFSVLLYKFKIKCIVSPVNIEESLYIVEEIRTNDLLIPTSHRSKLSLSKSIGETFGTYLCIGYVPQYLYSHNLNIFKSLFKSISWFFCKKKLEEVSIGDSIDDHVHGGKRREADIRALGNILLLLFIFHNLISFALSYSAFFRSMDFVCLLATEKNIPARYLRRKSDPINVEKRGKTLPDSSLSQGRTSTPRCFTDLQFEIQVFFS